MCKKFFLNTLAIGEKIISVVAQKTMRSVTGALSPDRRGRHVPANKLSDEIMQNIKNHIATLPIVEAHYCRRDSTKRYVEGTLTKVKTYRLYQLWCNDQNITVASQPVYERVFEDLNLAFHQQKKDECWHVAFERLPPEERTDEDQQKYDLHMRRKKAAEDEKASDKQLAAYDPTVMTIGMDMEALLYSPLLLATPVFYTRKLATSNFSIYDTKTKNGKC